MNGHHKYQINQHHHNGRDHPLKILWKLTNGVQIRVLNAIFHTIGTGDGDGRDCKPKGYYGHKCHEDG